MATAALLAAGMTGGAAAAPRVLSLDQCADQYVLALSPRSAIVGLSRRALNEDSALAPRATGLPLRRATSESVLAARPSIVVRYWGGDRRLLSDLARRGVRVVQIDDAIDFAGVRGNVRRVSRALGREPQGAALIDRMDRELAASAGAGKGDSALYLTSGYATAGRQTLIDAMLRSAGLVNLARGAGFRSVSIERLVLFPPRWFVLGFFDSSAAYLGRWALGGDPVRARLTRDRTLVSIPGALLGCPAWFATDGVALIAAQARRRASRPGT